MKKFEIGDYAITGDNTKVRIIDIVEEDGITWHECSPTEFNSFTRFLKADDLEKLETAKNQYIFVYVLYPYEDMDNHIEVKVKATDEFEAKMMLEDLTTEKARSGGVHLTHTYEY